MAVANYHSAHGRYPPPYVLGPDGRPWHSWRVLILPYVEQDVLFKEYRFDEPWDGPHNRELAGRMPRVYAFHGWQPPGGTTAHYLAVVGDETVWNPAKPVTEADVTDGSSQTILVVENRVGVPWMEPRDLRLDKMDFRVNADGGVSSPYRSSAVILLDTTVQALRRSMKPDVLRALFTIRGGEPIRDGEAGWDWLPDGRMRERVEP